MRRVDPSPSSPPSLSSDLVGSFLWLISEWKERENEVKRTQRAQEKVRERANEVERAGRQTILVRATLTESEQAEIRVGDSTQNKGQGDAGSLLSVGSLGSLTEAWWSSTTLYRLLCTVERQDAPAVPSVDWRSLLRSLVHLHSHVANVTAGSANTTDVRSALPAWAVPDEWHKVMIAAVVRMVKEGARATSPGTAVSPVLAHTVQCLCRAGQTKQLTTTLVNSLSTCLVEPPPPGSDGAVDASRFFNPLLASLPLEHTSTSLAAVLSLPLSPSIISTLVSVSLSLSSSRALPLAHRLIELVAWGDPSVRRTTSRQILWHIGRPRDEEGAEGEAERAAVLERLVRRWSSGQWLASSTDGEHLSLSHALVYLLADMEGVMAPSVSRLFINGITSHLSLPTSPRRAAGLTVAYAFSLATSPSHPLLLGEREQEYAEENERQRAARRVRERENGVEWDLSVAQAEERAQAEWSTHVRELREAEARNAAEVYAKALDGSGVPPLSAGDPDEVIGYTDTLSLLDDSDEEEEEKGEPELGDKNTGGADGEYLDESDDEDFAPAAERGTTRRVAATAPAHLAEAIRGATQQTDPTMAALSLSLLPRLATESAANNADHGVIALSVARQVVALRNTFESPTYLQDRRAALVALCASSPTTVAPFLVSSFYEDNLDVQQRSLCLEALAGGAKECPALHDHFDLFFYGLMVHFDRRVDLLGRNGLLLGQLTHTLALLVEEAGPHFPNILRATGRLRNFCLAIRSHSEAIVRRAVIFCFAALLHLDPATGEDAAVRRYLTRASTLEPDEPARTLAAAIVADAQAEPMIREL